MSKMEIQNGLSELKMVAEIVQQQLIQIFGEDDIDQCNNSTTSINKRKQESGSQRKAKAMIKHRRYRSIASLYLSTDPI